MKCPHLIHVLSSFQCLMPADSESEKTKWVVALNELHRILKKNKLPDKTVFRCREVLDNTVSMIKVINQS